MLPGAYGKPRPAVVVQKDIVSASVDSTIVCPLTSTLTPGTTLRVQLQPSAANGLRVTSQIMVDKIQAVPTAKIGTVIGRLEPAQLQDLNRALMIVLDLP